MFETVVSNDECCQASTGTDGLAAACSGSSGNNNSTLAQIPGGENGCINHNDPDNMGMMGGCEDYAHNESWCDIPSDMQGGWDASHCCICMHRQNFQPVGCGAWNATACNDDPSAGDATYYFDGSINECFKTETVAGAMTDVVVSPDECCRASNGTDDLY